MAEFKYRSTTTWVIPITIPFVGSVNLAFYASAEVSATGSGNNQTGGNATVSGDLILGAIKFVTGLSPVSYMGYINAQVTATRDINSIANTDVTKFDYKGSAGFILSSYLRIDERDSSGVTVRKVLLKDLVWTVANGTSTKGLHYISLSASNKLFQNTLHNGESVTFNFLIAEVLGAVTFGSIEVPVTPKTLESVIEINGWGYASSSNKLVLVCGVATGTAAGASAGTVTLASGSGKNQIYADFSKVVDVSGTKKSVTVTSTKVVNFSDVSDDTDVQVAAASVYNGTYSLALVEVALPAGASKITYDPTIGSGTPIQKSGASTVFFFSLLLSLVVLFI